jgi:tetratricopeptide (TPR) repeat protein
MGRSLKMSQTRRPFAENLDILFEELNLAIQWGRPSILLAIHKSQLSKARGEKALADRLKKLGQATLEIEVSSSSPDVAHQILKPSDLDGTVFFISNIDWGGSEDGRETYRALNVYRELFVENRIRAVFWLTGNEAVNLANHAPDFWAFRHQVVEFEGPRPSRKNILPAGVLLWHIQDSDRSADQVTEKILAREKLLRELPDRPESLAARLDLSCTLGYLYWRRGDRARAAELLSSAAGLAEGDELHGIKSWLLNGMAIVHYENGEYQRSAEIYEKLVEAGGQDSLLLINLGAALCALGKNTEAVSRGKRAARIEEGNPRIWNRLGYLYLSMGKLDEAAASLKRAIDLAPTHAEFYESLAICLGLLGLPDEALLQMNLARKFAEKGDALPDIYEEAILDKPAEALRSLEAAVDAQQLSRVDVQRNPNIHLLLDDLPVEEVPSWITASPS